MNDNDIRHPAALLRDTRAGGHNAFGDAIGGINVD